MITNTTTFTSHTPGGVPVYTGERVAEGDEQQLIMAHLGALRRAEWTYVAVQRETALLSRHDLTCWGSSIAYRTFLVRLFLFVSSLFYFTTPSGYDRASRRRAIRLGWPSDITR